MLENGDPELQEPVMRAAKIMSDAAQKMLTEEMKLGTKPGVALTALSDGMGFAMGLALSMSGGGGNLEEVLETMTNLIRYRAKEVYGWNTKGVPS